MRAMSHGAMERLLPLALALAACASPGTPPGGPEDDAPPAIVKLRPDTNALNVRSDGVSLDFDDVISERPQGQSSLADLFLISPSKGRNELEWHRTRLVVRPRGGFKPNTTYRVTMLPGLSDLDQNVDSVGYTVVFSTGPSLATGVIRGRVFEWMEERVAKLAFVEALILPDSTHFLTVADSLGAFELRNMPPGRYVLRGISDQNKNRLLDIRELYDTMTVVLQDSLRHELHALVRDTLGAGIERVEVEDSVTLRIRFDRALDTAQAIVPGNFTVKTKDSVLVPIASVLGARVVKKQREDSVRAKAIQDSVRRAADTTATRDSARRDTARPPAAPTPGRAQQAAAAARAAARRLAGRGGPNTPIDTTPPPKSSVRVPEIEVVVRLETPLPPATAIRVRSTGLRTIMGRSRASERQLVTPKAKADSAKAPARRPAPRDTSREGR